MLPNFKVVGPTEAELHILTVETLDTCIGPLFAISVTYIMFSIESDASGYIQNQ